MFKRLSIFVASLFLFVLVSNVNAQPLMSIEELNHLLESSKHGQIEGHFDSVERGREIKSYQIIIRGIQDLGGRKNIVFVTSHKIVAGMSGSPTYVNGKLIGAVAYQSNQQAFNNWKWGGISPIEKMIQEADQGSSDSLPVAFRFVYQGMDFEPIPLGHYKPEESLSVGNVNLGGQLVAQAPSGDMLKTKASDLKAGMPILVNLIGWEDGNGNKTDLGALGTITYIDSKGKVFAFGHPFLSASKVQYAFKTCEIIGTVFSEGLSYKLSGKSSEVLGTIYFDSSYGIYGNKASSVASGLHVFNLELKNNGQKLNSFKIKIADASLTPQLVSAAFSYIGRNNGAPIPEESRVTEIKANFELAGYASIEWEELFSPRQFQFGPNTIKQSSYELATDKLISGIYRDLFESSYNFKITSVNVVANFISGQAGTLKVAYYNFPSKIVWGKNPTLDIALVSEDNSIVITKRIPVEIKWDNVEKPIYTKNIRDVDKESEKIIGGSLNIYSADLFDSFVGLDSEKQIFNPEYFLNAQDFLSFISSRLKATNQKIFAKLYMKSKSNLFSDLSADQGSGKDLNFSPSNNGWNVVNGGLKKRLFTIKNENSIPVYIDLPLVPSGYVVAPQTRENLRFEVVLE